jgi:hypothetical protein
LIYYNKYNAKIQKEKSDNKKMNYEKQEKNNQGDKRTKK